MCPIPQCDADDAVLNIVNVVNLLHKLGPNLVGKNKEKSKNTATIGGRLLFVYVAFVLSHFSGLQVFA
jgi:hypothetical protein